MSERHIYPDISDILALKASARRERARLSFGEKLEILERLRERIAPIVQARQMRRSLEENSRRDVEVPGSG